MLRPSTSGLKPSGRTRHVFPSLLDPGSSAPFQCRPRAGHSISIWEIGIKVGRGRLSIPLPVRDYAERLARIARVDIIPVDTEVWLTNLELPWDHRDPADRTLVATAMVNSRPLVTSDRTIRAFYLRSVW